MFILIFKLFKTISKTTAKKNINKDTVTTVPEKHDPTKNNCDPICKNLLKCTENVMKMYYNVFQPIGNAFKRAVIISKCVGNVP